MKTFYATFGHGQPNFPGYVRIWAPDEITARQIMIEEFDNRYCSMLCDESEIFADDKVFRGELRYSDVNGSAMRMECEICGKLRLQGDITTFSTELMVGRHDVRMNVNHCIDNRECCTGAIDSAYEQAQKMLEVFRDYAEKRTASGFLGA